MGLGEKIASRLALQRRDILGNTVASHNWSDRTFYETISERVVCTVTCARTKEFDDHFLFPYFKALCTYVDLHGAVIDC